MSNVLRPDTSAPTLLYCSRIIAALAAETLDVIVLLGTTNSVSPAEYQAKSRIPPSPSGCSGPSFGPAMKPSSDMVRLVVTLPIAILLAGSRYPSQPDTSLTA